MTALDQALIKAYVRRGAGTEAAATPVPRPVVPLSQALAEMGGPRSPTMSIDSLLADKPAPVATPAPRVVAPVTEPAAEPVAAPVAEPPATKSRSKGSSARPATATKERSRSRSRSTRATSIHTEIHTEPAGSILPMGSIDATPQNVVTEPRQTLPLPTPAPARPQGATYRADPAVSEVHPSATESCAVPPPHLAALPAEPEPEPQATVEPAPWRPMLQVEHCVWPETWSRLQTKAVRQMDQMTEELSAIVQSGRKVLGFGSCSSGEGVTTLTLAAGRRLALRGLKVALVDANLANPQIAASLGLLPEMGWEETLAGRMPLEEVLIESVAENLTILPVSQAIEDPAGAATDELPIIESLDTLAKHYDAVLIDLGPLENPATASGLLGRGIRQRMDAVILVQNVRSTTPDRLADFQNNLATADIAHAGTIQNFVAR